MTPIKESEPPALSSATPYEALAEALMRTDGEPDPTLLADRTGLDPEFVESVIDELRRHVPERSWQEVALAVVAERAVQFWHGAVGLARRATDRPLAFVGVTGLLALLSTSLIDGAALLQIGPRPGAGVDGMVLGFTVLAHMLCYARHSKAGTAALGGVMAFGAIAVALLLSPGPGNELPPFVKVIAAFVLALAYTGLAVGVSVAGAWLRLQGKQRQEVSQTRQQLLERLFSVRSRLAGSKPARSTIRLRPEWTQKPRFFGYVALAAAGVVALRALVFGTLSRTAPFLFTGPNVVVLTLDLAFFGLGLALLISACFFAGGVRRAVWTVVTIYGAFSLTGFAFARASEAFRTGPTPWPVGIAMLVVAVASGLAARVREATLQEHRLAQDDPAALVAELVRLQRRLSSERASTCVVSVDVVKSTRMKEGADPYLVEYSFREYQALVARMTEAWEGTVLSTTGDGAIVGFGDCRHALQAAKMILNELPHFNRKSNRLALPFRLRIGMHSGEVQGTLSDVQFTQVIDIAAHVQKEAPVGGILVTESVARHLEGERLAELRDQVEGQRVFAVLNPTLGA